MKALTTLQVQAMLKASPNFGRGAVKQDGMLAA